jgi:cytoskeleton protein RodZ
LGAQNEGAEHAATPGEWLSQVRSQQGLTPQQAAEGLNLDVWVVEAIESNRFSALGPPVYARGHLRKYATLLGLSADDVLARYEQLNDTPTVQDPIPISVVAPVRGVRSNRPIWPRVLGSIAVLVVLAAIAFMLFRYFEQRSNQGRTQGVAESNSTASTEPSARASEGTAQAAQVIPADVSVVAPVASAATSTKVEPHESADAGVSSIGPATETSNVTVRLEFSDTCWTEVYDASNKRLMFDNGLAGRTRTLTGAAPLRVMVGMASGVKLDVNDKPTVIPRRAGRESARFTIGVDGTVKDQ